MSRLAESHWEMEFYFIQHVPIRSCGRSSLSPVIKDTAGFHSKRKEGGKLNISFNFALNFIVMCQEEATKDRRWPQVGIKWFKLLFCSKAFIRFILSGMQYELNFSCLRWQNRAESAFVLGQLCPPKHRPKRLAQICLHRWNFFSKADLNWINDNHPQYKRFWNRD